MLLTAHHIPQCCVTFKNFTLDDEELFNLLSETQLYKPTIVKNESPVHSVVPPITKPSGLTLYLARHGTQLHLPKETKQVVNFEYFDGFTQDSYNQYLESLQPFNDKDTKELECRNFSFRSHISVLCHLIKCLPKL